MTLVLAHRGSGPHGPERENTVAAFLAARRFGADGVELDVRRTADHRLVVHHDAEVADGRRLCLLEAGELPEEVPSLAEALEACGDLVVNVEIKNAPQDPDFDRSQWVAMATAALLLGRGGDDRFVVSSFSRRALRAFSLEAPRIETAWLVGPGVAADEACAGATAVKTAGVHPYDTSVDEEYVRIARRQGLVVRVWTVDDPVRVAELARIGVEAVITNDVPAAQAGCRAAQLA